MKNVCCRHETIIVKSRTSLKWITEHRSFQNMKSLILLFIALFGSEAKIYQIWSECDGCVLTLTGMGGLPKSLSWLYKDEVSFTALPSKVAPTYSKQVYSAICQHFIENNGRHLENVCKAVQEEVLTNRKLLARVNVSYSLVILWQRFKTFSLTNYDYIMAPKEYSRNSMTRQTQSKLRPECVRRTWAVTIAVRKHSKKTYERRPNKVGH